MHCRGYIIIFVLFLIAILSGLSAELIRTLNLNTKINATYFQRLSGATHTPKILQQIGRLLLVQEPLCAIATINPKQLAHQPLAFWQQWGCVGEVNQHIYYYLVESLGKDECAVVTDALKRTIADYKRITLYYTINTMIGTRIILQGTFLKPIMQDDPTCRTTMKRVQAGWQAYREI